MTNTPPRNEAVIFSIRTGTLHAHCAGSKIGDLYAGIEYIVGAPGMMSHHMGAAQEVLSEHFLENVEAWRPLTDEQRKEFFRLWGIAMQPIIEALYGGGKKHIVVRCDGASAAGYPVPR